MALTSSEMLDVLKQTWNEDRLGKQMVEQLYGRKKVRPVWVGSQDDPRVLQIRRPHRGTIVYEHIIAPGEYYVVMPLGALNGPCEWWEGGELRFVKPTHLDDGWRDPNDVYG